MKEAFAVFQSKEALFRELNAATQDLVELDSPPVRARLWQVAQTSKDERVLYWTCRALVELDKSKVAPLLVGRMERSDETVSPRIIELLRETGDRRAAPVLVKMAKSGKTSRHRSAALTALAGTADREGVLAVLNALDDKDYYVRRAARDALVVIASNPAYKNAVSELLARRFEKGEGKRAAVALQLLGRIGGDAAEGAVKDGLRSRETDILQAAIRAAGELKIKSAADRLLEIAGDTWQPSPVRELALKALADVATAEEVPEIVSLLDDDSAALKDSAHSTLCRLTGEKVPPSKSAWDIQQSRAESEEDDEYAFEQDVPPAPKPSNQRVAARRAGISVYTMLGVGAAALAVGLLALRSVLLSRRKARMEAAMRRKIRRDIR